MATDPVNRGPKGLHWLRISRRWLFGNSIAVAIAYAGITVSLALLFIPSREAAEAIPFVLAISALFIFLGQKRRLGELEIALLSIVLAQAAAARWSIALDDASARRSSDAEGRDEKRRIQALAADSSRRAQERAEQDSAIVYTIHEALVSNRRALEYNDRLLNDELGFAQRSMISLAATQPLETEWWSLLVRNMPATIARRPARVDSLRRIAESTALVKQHFDARQTYELGETSLRAAPAGARDPFLVRLEKLDKNLLILSANLQTQIRQFERSYGTDSIGANPHVDGRP